MLDGLALERCRQPIQLLQQDGGGIDKLGGEGGVEDVGAGQPEMDPARLRAQRLAHGGDKGDDVVADLGLDLVDPLQHV
jgi:hypothetical protein